MKCEICNKNLKSYQGLSKHITANHNITSQMYYDKYIRPPNVGICICGKPTPFLKLSKGYQKHCCARCAQLDPDTKNNFRVSNPQKDKEIRKRMQETCITKYGGVGFASQSIQQKAIQTRLDRYGIANTYQLPNNSNKKRLSTIEVKLCKYMKENNLVFIEEAFTLNDNCGWVNDIEIIIYLNRRLIHKSDLDYIKNYKSTKNFTLTQQIINEIKSIYQNEIILDYNIIEPVNIYLPDLNLAIDINGIYNHALENGTPIDYHLNKSLACRDKNIRLIHIYEFEDIDNQIDLLKNLILGNDLYPENDFNKNNLLHNIPNPSIIYIDARLTIYGAGELIY